MTPEFEHVRHNARSSALAAAGRRIIEVIAAAWATSVAGGRYAAVSTAFGRATPPARLRWWTTTIAVAALMHLLLRALLSSTVIPAMPASVYFLIAGVSAAIALSAEAFHRAWAGSWVVGFGSWVVGKTRTHDPGPKTRYDRN